MELEANACGANHKLMLLVGGDGRLRLVEDWDGLVALDWGRLKSRERWLRARFWPQARQSFSTLITIVLGTGCQLFRYRFALSAMCFKGASIGIVLQQQPRTFSVNYLVFSACIFLSLSVGL
jgi:hypothetical protein